MTELIEHTSSIATMEGGENTVINTLIEALEKFGAELIKANTHLLVIKTISNNSKAYEHLDISSSKHSSKTIHKEQIQKIQEDFSKKTTVETTKKHSPSLQMIIFSERANLYTLKFENVRGSFMLNTVRNTAIYNSKNKTSKATERLVYKQLVPHDLPLEYLLKIEHLCHSGPYLVKVQKRIEQLSTQSEP